MSPAKTFVIISSVAIVAILVVTASGITSVGGTRPITMPGWVLADLIVGLPLVGAAIISLLIGEDP